MADADGRLKPASQIIWHSPCCSPFLLLIVETGHKRALADTQLTRQSVDVEPLGPEAPEAVMNGPQLTAVPVCGCDVTEHVTGGRVLRHGKSENRFFGGGG